MAFSSILTDYLGEGVAASRPTTPSIAGTALAFFYATDTHVLSLWNGAAWVTLNVGADPSFTTVHITGLPASDPASAGELWVTTSGALAVSGVPPLLPFGFVIAGLPGAGQVYNLVMGMACSIHANFAGTVVFDTTLTTANAIFTVNKISSGSTTAIGTLTITNSSHTSVTLSTQAAVTMAAGDVLQLVAPGSQDATLADLGITILATKV